MFKVLVLSNFGSEACLMLFLSGSPASVSTLNGGWLVGIWNKLRWESNIFNVTLATNLNDFLKLRKCMWCLLLKAFSILFLTLWGVSIQNAFKSPLKPLISGVLYSSFNFCS